MFTKSAALYDVIYTATGKDYSQEVHQLHHFIQKYKQCPGNRLLDIACGTCMHIVLLRQFYNYSVEGLDLDENILAVARERYSDLTLHCADMVNFTLDHQFDVVTCLFSSIGYVRTVPQLKQAIHNMIQHVNYGGLVIIEPWFGPDHFQAGYVHAVFVDEPQLKIARMNVSAIENGLSILNFHYLVATPSSVDYFTERHELGLFSHDDYIEAMSVSGLETIYDPEGLDGRGLYVGKRPLK